MSDRLNAYREVAVQTASGIKLVVMLYEGTIRFLRESVAAIESKDLDRKRHCVDRAVAIVQHLQGSLDMERGGEVASGLNSLYSYITSLILDGSAKLETAPLKEAIELLNVLLEGWEEVAKRAGGDIALPRIVAPTGLMGGFALHA
jgi:flagellar protein FliS